MHAPAAWCPKCRQVMPSTPAGDCVDCSALKAVRMPWTRERGRDHGPADPRLTRLRPTVTMTTTGVK